MPSCERARQEVQLLWGAGGFRIRLGRPGRVSLAETTLDGRASLARIPGR